MAFDDDRWRKERAPERGVGWRGNNLGVADECARTTELYTKPGVGKTERPIGKVGKAAERRCGRRRASGEARHDHGRYFEMFTASLGLYACGQQNPKQFNGAHANASA